MHSLQRTGASEHNLSYFIFYHLLVLFVHFDFSTIKNMDNKPQSMSLTMKLVPSFEQFLVQIHDPVLKLHGLIVYTKKYYLQKW